MIAKQKKSVAAGIVEASPGEVSELLLTVRAGRRDGDSLPLVLTGIATGVEITGGPHEFTVMTADQTPAARLCFIRIDPAERRISIYGGWWFLGEYTIGPHRQGSVLTYSLYNAAGGISGVVAGFLHRRELRAAKPTLEGMLQKLGARLGCAARITEPD